jgi:hypothetical protein
MPNNTGEGGRSPHPSDSWPTTIRYTVIVVAPTLAAGVMAWLTTRH